jgi:hypothetical protein
MVTEAGVAARVVRLHELSIGLAREDVLIGKGQDSLLYLERKAYLAAIRDALAGVEGARVVLARARQRLTDAASVQPMQGDSDRAA